MKKREYLSHKAARSGIEVGQIPEDYSTRTYSGCGQVAKAAPRGRSYHCPGCGAKISRLHKLLIFVGMVRCLVRLI